MSLCHNDNDSFVAVLLAIEARDKREQVLYTVDCRKVKDGGADEDENATWKRHWLEVMSFVVFHAY